MNVKLFHALGPKKLKLYCTSGLTWPQRRVKAWKNPVADAIAERRKGQKSTGSAGGRRLRLNSVKISPTLRGGGAHTATKAVCRGISGMRASLASSRERAKDSADAIRERPLPPVWGLSPSKRQAKPPPRGVDKPGAGPKNGEKNHCGGPGRCAPGPDRPGWLFGGRLEEFCRAMPEAAPLGAVQ